MPEEVDGKVKEKLAAFMKVALKKGITTSPSDIATLLTTTLGVADEKKLHARIIGMINGVQREDFLKAQGDVFLFIPHCLRNPTGCAATLSDEGYQCKKCGKCKIKEIITLCETHGVRPFIVGGGRQVFTIVERYRPAAAIGVACFAELQLALEKLDIPSQAILLARDGCVGTDVDVEEVSRVLLLRSPSPQSSPHGQKSDEKV